MKAARIVLVFIVTLALLCSSLVSTAAQSTATSGPIPKPVDDGTTIVRVYYPDLATGNKVLISFEAELLETNYEQGYHIMEVTHEDIDRLLAAGLRVVPDDTWVAPAVRPLAEASAQTISGYSCYRTVEETFAAAQALAAAHPKLATWTDVGNSWLKSQGSGGYDLMVLKLTNSDIPGPKPKLFVTAAIHAREYATAELVTRFGEYLVNSYGVDADATWLLDYHEVHLMLQTNPDGRKKAETGLMWRKNVDNNDGCTNSSTWGTDLNRNFAFQWACCGGSSGSPCNETYHGPSAASEPETQAVQAYMTSIFPDQRGPNLTDPAPLDATGVYIDMHSYGKLVLWPWGFTSTPPPNATRLQTLGRKWAYFNGHTPEQAIGLYVEDGTTKEYSYGVFGIPGYTWEVGTSFFQSCSYFTGTLWPANLPALVYAAKVVRTPYMTPAGPDALSLTLSTNNVPAGTAVTLSATINDTRYNNSNGTEPTQNIAAAEYYVDTPPWVSGATAYTMAASDGSFNSTAEGVTASVNTSVLSAAKHILFVRGKDANNNWGAFSAIFLTLTGPANQAPTANPKSVTTDEDSAVDIALSGSDPEGDPLTFNVTGGPTHATLSGTVPNLTYTPAANYNGADSFTFVANDGHSTSAPATVSITITPVNDAPVANAQSVTTQQDTQKAITLSGSDVDGDTVTFAVQQAPTHGTLEGTAPDLTYTPESGYVGSDSFTFLVSDAQYSSDPATVSIAVKPVNHAPVADTLSVTTNEDTAVAIILTGSDPDGDALTFSVTGAAGHGTLSGSGPNVTYTPASNYNGADSFTFVANDGQVNSAPATVDITVTPVNDAPVANAQSVTTQQGTAVAITLTGSDLDGDALSYSVVTSPGHGSLSGTAPNLTYTPASGYSGSDSFTFTVDDGALTSAAATVSITVNPTGPVTVFSDDFETNQGWTRNPSGTDTATLGLWERANPETTTSSGTKQMGTTASGSYDLVTGPLAGSGAGDYDIDGGATTIRSPNIALPAGKTLTLSFKYYLAHGSNSSSADYLRVKVVGSTTTTVLQELGAANNDNAAWASYSGSISTYAGQTVYLLIEAADASGASLVEAAVDDVKIVAQ